MNIIKNDVEPIIPKIENTPDIQKSLETIQELNEKYKDYWFFGQTRLTGNQIEPDIYYWIRFKNKTNSFTNYKLLEKTGNQIILEQKDGMHDEKIIKFNIHNIYYLIKLHLFYHNLLYCFFLYRTVAVCVKSCEIHYLIKLFVFGLHHYQ